MPDFTRVINLAYQRILGRPADAGGLDSYNRAMNAGLAEADIWEALLRSAEYADKHPSRESPTTATKSTTVSKKGAAKKRRTNCVYARRKGSRVEECVYDFERVIEGACEEILRRVKDDGGLTLDAATLTSPVHECRRGPRSLSATLASASYRRRKRTSLDGSGCLRRGKRAGLAPLAQGGLRFSHPASVEVS